MTLDMMINTLEKHPKLSFVTGTVLRNVLGMDGYKDIIEDIQEEYLTEKKIKSKKKSQKARQSQSAAAPTSRSPKKASLKPA